MLPNRADQLVGDRIQNQAAAWRYTRSVQNQLGSHEALSSRSDSHLFKAPATAHFCFHKVSAPAKNGRPMVGFPAGSY